jgi:hypothetical protein
MNNILSIPWRGNVIGDPADLPRRRNVYSELTSVLRRPRCSILRVPASIPGAGQRLGRSHRPRRLVGQRAAGAAERSAKVAEDAVTPLKDRHRVSPKRSLVLPEIAEPLGRKFAISNRVLDVLVAEIVLQRPSIHTLIG